jgi:hypothetical protein
MCWHGSASGKRGRSPKYSEAAIQFWRTVKGRFNLALRQVMGLVQSLLEMAGLDWEESDFRTGSRRRKHLAVRIVPHPTTKGLHLLVDSTGTKMLGEGEWKANKHRAGYRRPWRKVHLGIDASTLETRAIEVTDNAFLCASQPLKSFQKSTPSGLLFAVIRLVEAAAAAEPILGMPSGAAPERSRQQLLTGC